MHKEMQLLILIETVIAVVEPSVDSPRGTISMMIMSSFGSLLLAMRRPVLNHVTRAGTKVTCV